MKRICVYCGSSVGRDPCYAETARALAEALVARDLALVYGGAAVGIMGVLADTVLAAGGKVVGVIPQALVAKEVAHENLTELRVVGSMHERKALMAELADGFIALSGGLGTVEELFEVLTWAQLGFHAKPCGLVNIHGYFDGLTKFLEHAVHELFVKESHREMLMVEASPERLLDRFAAYRAPQLTKWLGREEV
jgi:uncharacterized protein (TIGR00730 family)